MVQSVESRVHKLLLEHGDSLKVADILLKDWDSGSLAWVEQNAVGHFLIKCGYLRSLMDQVSKNLKQGQRIPWSSFVEALSLSKTKLTKDDFDQIFVGAAEEQALGDLVKCVKLDDQDPRFKKIRNSMESTVLKKEARHRDIVDNSDKTNAKTRTIQRPQNLVPKPVNETRVRPTPHTVTPTMEKLTRENFKDDRTATFIRNAETTDPEEDALRAKARMAFEMALKKSKGGELEAAIALAMMGSWEDGLEILRRIPPSFKKSCLELQFLLQAKKNVEVLELCRSLLAMSPNLEQKSYFQFIQAQALLELKRTNDAYTVLEDLLGDDPDHYSARALLMQIKARAK